MKNEDELYAELYGVRLLIFQEDSPQSNKYRQVIVDQKQFKKISDATIVGEPPTSDAIQKVTVRLSEETYVLPDLQEILYE